MEVFFYIYDHYLPLNSLGDKLMILYLCLMGGFISYFQFCNINNYFVKIMDFLQSSYFLDYFYLTIQSDFMKGLYEYLDLYLEKGFLEHFIGLYWSKISYVYFVCVSYLMSMKVVFMMGLYVMVIF